MRGLCSRLLDDLFTGSAGIVRRTGLTVKATGRGGLVPPGGRDCYISVSLTVARCSSDWTGRNTTAKTPRSPSICHENTALHVTWQLEILARSPSGSALLSLVPHDSLSSFSLRSATVRICLPQNIRTVKSLLGVLGALAVLPSPVPTAWHARPNSNVAHPRGEGKPSTSLTRRAAPL